MSKCPICDAMVAPRAENKLFPFCSPRCKTIDLGKWLSEDYRVPSGEVEGTDDSDEGGRSDSKRDMRH